MVSIDTVRKLALSFEETEEEVNSGITSFFVKKKLFATMNPKENRTTLRFSAIDQDVFCAFDSSVIYPVPNTWGSKYGWTHINLKKIRKDMFIDALNTAYCNVAPKKLAEKYLQL
jgi:hypothetical protein